jgi:carbonic anhydrase/acetyltransferase-like protein (isoleucine patch superfamily)
MAIANTFSFLVLIQVGGRGSVGAATVLKGVATGKSSVALARSAVAKAIPASCIASGNPATRIRAIENRIIERGENACKL